MPGDRRINLSVELLPCVLCGTYTDTEELRGGSWVRVCSHYWRHPSDGRANEKEPPVQDGKLPGPRRAPGS